MRASDEVPAGKISRAGSSSPVMIGWGDDSGPVDLVSQTGHEDQDVTHGVPELFTIHVTVELLCLLLDSASPIVLNLVVRFYHPSIPQSWTTCYILISKQL
ncbi:hypothetical protein PanWU01x14_144310 [Parasponia andersonii]|uniref:Uncharacterized protein n=1 Tax=Parasponia andersonii TaxID=3476 RepID=A0A2P5CL41_PARAD|nr:hypothetical protein PanWU01x14_144310 [Parasponia andersonii]